MTLDLKPWNLHYELDWDVNFKDFDSSTKIMIWKKIQQLKQPLRGRGLHSSRYLVEEVGQYRIVYDEIEETKTRRIYFVGDHKQYEKWYKL